MLSEANRRSQLRIMRNLRVGDLRLTAFGMTSFPSKPGEPLSLDGRTEAASDAVGQTHKTLEEPHVIIDHNP